MSELWYDVDRPLSPQDVQLMNPFLTPEYQIHLHEVTPPSTHAETATDLLCDEEVHTETPTFPTFTVDLNDSQKRALTKRSFHTHTLSWDTPLDLGCMELHNLTPHRDATVQSMSTYLGQLIDSETSADSPEVHNACLSFANTFVYDAVTMERLTSMVHYTCFHRPHARTSVKGRGPRARTVREFINPLNQHPLLAEASASNTAPRLVCPPAYYVYAYHLKKTGQPYIFLPRLTIPACLDEGQLLAVAGCSAHFVGEFGDHKTHSKFFVVLSRPDGSLSPFFFNDKQSRTYMCLVHGRYQKKPSIRRPTKHTLRPSRENASRLGSCLPRSDHIKI